MSLDLDKEHKRTLEKCKFFRDSQIWPLAPKIDYKGWLNNFNEQERRIMAVVLDYFVFFNDTMIDHLLDAAIGLAGRSLAKMDADWTYQKLYSDCWYSYMPGTFKASVSGRIFPRKLHKFLGIPDAQIIDHADLRLQLMNSKEPMKLILVDDFVGSGEQCINLWNRYRPRNEGTYPPTMGEICRDKGHTVVYAPLVANYSGINRITQSCERLIVSPVHTLGPEYNIFSETCPCWHGDYHVYNLNIS